MVSHLKTFTNKGCEIAAQKRKGFFEGNLDLINYYSLSQFCKDQEVIHQGSAGYTTRIRRLYNKDQEVISRIFWYQCYYPHWSGDALSPVCGIFFLLFLCNCPTFFYNVLHTYWTQVGAMRQWNQFKVLSSNAGIQFLEKDNT